jgi:hypothetical protein
MLESADLPILNSTCLLFPVLEFSFSDEPLQIFGIVGLKIFGTQV